MVGPIFAREREWIDQMGYDFDRLPQKQQIAILRRARRALARHDQMLQQAREAEGLSKPKRRPYWAY